MVFKLHGTENGLPQNVMPAVIVSNHPPMSCVTSKGMLSTVRQQGKRIPVRLLNYGAKSAGTLLGCFKRRIRGEPLLNSKARSASRRA